MVCLCFGSNCRGKLNASDVDLNKPLEVSLITAARAVSTCGPGYPARLTSGRAFSGFRVHSCPELAAPFQTGPLPQLHKGPPHNSLFSQFHT